MRLYLAFVADLYTPFDHTIHTDMDDDGLFYEFYHAEGEVAEVRIERPQQGWAFLTPGAPLCAIISESVTGDPADAVPIARGRITGMPDGMFEMTQTITISCSPQNFLHIDDRHRIADGPLMAFARANLASMPDTMPYLGDFDRNDPATYLLGRPMFYHCDPVTHAVSVSHVAVGDRVVNLSAAHFHDEKSVPTTTWGDPPVPRARLKLIAPWTQQGTRLCNIASRLRGSSSIPIRTHSPDFIENAGTDFPSGLAGFSRGTGWTMEEQNSRVQTARVDGASFRTQRIYDRTYYSYNTFGVTVESDPFTIRHRELMSFTEFRHRIQSLWMRAEYAQDREEIAWCVLTQPIQPFRAVALDMDEGEFTTVELTADLTALPWEPGEWFAGERVQYGNAVYVCKERHISTDFWQQKSNTKISGTGFYWKNFTYEKHPFWEKVVSTAAMRIAGNRFFDTDLGRQVVAHGMLRLEKALLLRSRALTVTVDYDWETVRGITLRDSVRLEVPWPHDGTSRIVVGKVMAISKSWDESGAVATLTLGVSIGDGANAQTGSDLSGVYNTDGYFPDDYMTGQDPVSGVGGIDFVIDADRVPRPINVEALRNPGYAVKKVTLENEAPSQLAAARSASARGLNPLEAVRLTPTRLRVQMRDLATEGTFKRNLYVAGVMLTSPRGIDVVNGGEP